jgi:hypothetical protein
MTTKTAQKDNAALVATAQAGAIATINFDLLQPLELPRQGYPLLQPNKYQDISSDSKLFFGFAQKAVDMMSAEVYDAFGFEIQEADYGKGSEPFFVPSPSIRWVPLAFPSEWIEDSSDENKKVYKPKGSEFNGKCKTACKLFMVAVSGDSLISDADGKPQIVTTNFKGLRTTERVFGGSEGSLLALNSKLLQHYQVKESRYMGHLVSLEIAIKVSRYQSKKDASLKSVGADIHFTGAAKLLPPHLQEMTTALVRLDHQLKAAIADPFNIGGDAVHATLEDGEHPF